ncbi:hypothetical protein HUU51_01270 [Candidatus Gracilibacteria bacterium]|nr:hypothetical protein [Candidatus Gracilibacteria bacterium]
MENKIYKKYDFSFYLTKENFNKLYDFLNKYYNKIDLEIIIRDSTEIKLTKEDFLNYDNYYGEDIIELKINCSISNDYKNSLDIKLGDSDINDFFESGNSFRLHSTDKLKFKEIKEGLEKILFNDFKVWYSFLNKGVIYSILNVIILDIIIYLCFKNYFDHENKYIIIYLLSIAVLIFIQHTPYKALFRFIFPKFIFGIGNQEKQIENKKNWRNIIFIVIILGIILSIVGSYLYSFISK